MDPMKPELVWELTPAGWKRVKEIRARESEPLQQAAGYKVVVKVAGDVVPMPKYDPGQSFFYTDKGSRQRTTAESILMTLADFQEKGVSPTQTEIGKAMEPPISGEAVNAQLLALKTAGLVVAVDKKQRANVVSPTGRKWLWNLQKKVDVASVVSHLMADGKITADDIAKSEVAGSPDDQQAVMQMLGLGEPSV